VAWAAPGATASETFPPPVVAAFSPAPPASALQTYQVFIKPTQRQAETFVTHAGAVEARFPGEALALALNKFTTQPVFVWWIVPDAALIRSDPAEAESLFAPAAAKPYRSPNFYHVLTQMRAVRAQTEAAPEAQAAPAPAPPNPPSTDP